MLKQHTRISLYSAYLILLLTFFRVEEDPAEAVVIEDEVTPEVVAAAAVEEEIQIKKNQRKNLFSILVNIKIKKSVSSSAVAEKVSRFKRINVHPYL